MASGCAAGKTGHCRSTPGWTSRWPCLGKTNRPGGSRKRSQRHRQHLFTFLDNSSVPFDNNAAKRAIRRAVILRKDSYGNRSQRGDTQAVLMSIDRTLKQRGHDPLKTITEALANYPTTGVYASLPP
jgi:hypothetical protein